MGLFSRRQEGDVSEPSINSDDAAPGSDSGIGPWDAAHAPERPGSAGRIDLGSLRIPAVDGMQIRLESPGGSSQEVSAAVLVLAGSTLELRAFAAPRTAGIWNELREDITAELDRAKARFDVEDGPHGLEILPPLMRRLHGFCAGFSPTSWLCAMALPGRRGRFFRFTPPGSALLPPPRIFPVLSLLSPGRPSPRSAESWAPRLLGGDSRGCAPVVRISTLSMRRSRPVVGGPCPWASFGPAGGLRSPACCGPSPSDRPPTSPSWSASSSTALGRWIWCGSDADRSPGYVLACI